MFLAQFIIKGNSHVEDGLTALAHLLRKLHQNGTNELVEAKIQPQRSCRTFAGGQAVVCSSTDQEGEERRGREIFQLPYHASESQEWVAKCFQLPSTASPAAQRYMAHLSHCPTDTFHPAGDIPGLGVPALRALSDGVPGSLAERPGLLQKASLAD